MLQRFVKLMLRDYSSFEGHFHWIFIGFSWLSFLRIAPNTDVMRDEVKHLILTSLIISPSDLPADWRIVSGINGSVYADVDAMLPLSDDVALVFGDVAEFLTN